MIFISSYFRPTLSHPAHCMELRNRVEVEFLRNSSRVPFSMHLPTLSPPLPSSKSMLEARRGPRNHRVRVPIFQYRLGAHTPGNSVDRFQGTNRISPRNTKQLPQRRWKITRILPLIYPSRYSRRHLAFCSDDRTIFGTWFRTIGKRTNYSWERRIRDRYWRSSSQARSRDTISTTKRRRRRRRRLCSMVGSCSICTYGSKSDLILVSLNSNVTSIMVLEFMLLI